MRLTTKNVEKFQHDGLVVDTGWSEFNYAKADAKAQQSFRDHVGRFVQIHPDDIAELAGLGLALDGGRVVEAKPVAAPPPAPPPPPTAAAATPQPSDPVQAEVKAADDGRGKSKGK